MINIADKELSIEEVKQNLATCKNTLQQYFDDMVIANSSDTEVLKLRNEYFKWIDIKTNLIDGEKNFNIPEEVFVKRGDVYWIEFGYNIGEEFGGRHPGIVLRKGGNTAIVLPVSTQQPTENQLNSGIYVEIVKIYSYKNCKRWVNVLNACPISLCRFCFDDNIGNIKGWELDKINEAMQNTKLYIVKKKNDKNT